MEHKTRVADLWVSGLRVYQFELYTFLLKVGSFPLIIKEGRLHHAIHISVDLYDYAIFRLLMPSWCVFYGKSTALKIDFDLSYFIF